MIEIELSNKAEIWSTVWRLVYDQLLFCIILAIFSYINSAVITSTTGVLFTLTINMVFILIPFLIRLIKVARISKCFYDKNKNTITVDTSRWKGYIQPENYLVLTVRKVRDNYYIYEGDFGINIPRKCIILTDKGYRTWVSLYDELIG